MKSKGEMTRERILTEASRLVHRKGFEATSLNDVMTVTGLKKGCLYFHFSGKEELSFAILEKAKADFFAFFDAALAGKQPGDRLDHFLKEALDMNRKSEFDGCIFGNTALEMSGKNRRVAEFVGEFFAEWTDRIAGLVKDAQKASRIRQDCSAPFLAKHIVMSLEGGIMLSRIEKNEKPLKDCIASLRTLLEMKP